MGWRLLLGVLGALAAWPGCAHAVVPRGPDGPEFYRPPAHLLAGPAGSIVWARPASDLVALDAARRTTVVVYRSRGIDGRPVVMSASVALPHGRPPAGGWRTVVWNHVTTGAADACAPSQVTAENAEFERMTRGDVLAGRLVEAGLVVVRPDYEGIGTPGPHPYLIGRSLARSAVDAMRAARALHRRVSREWAVAGHSEGGVAALFTGELAPRLAPRLRLRAVNAIAPPTRMRDYFEAGALIPVTGPVIDGLAPLGGLVLAGAATAEPRLAELYAAGALSPEANALLPHIEERCLNDLTRSDSWGGIAPADIPGPRVEEAKPLLYRVLDANDPRVLRIAPAVPVRLDQGVMDPVVPVAFAEELAATLRRNGADVLYARHPTGTHQNITADDQAAGPASAWLAARLAGDTTP